MKINKGYKLFEQREDGKLFPLFIGKTKETPMHKWVMAEIVMEHKGFAHRPGWHIGSQLPSAPWLMGADGTYRSQRGKRFKRVWCEVEYVADVNYTEEVKRLPKKCFIDKLPDNGYYEFKESGDRLWIIADRIKITKIISENERQEILKEMNYDEEHAFLPYKARFENRKGIVA